ncbi:alpha-amylase-like protein [Apodospora peruviana]|uniref:Alpha-amylase-like protein n=1 Tax=Apodospora peruviana TaxID=516989 RepID=A0AAE0HU54_9PEZI|nr:alpha-amylase-like protein [Apodospora peruviana]
MMSQFLGLESHRPPNPPTADNLNQQPAILSHDLRPLRRRRPATELPSPFIVPGDRPCPENKTMIQGFEWYIPADFAHWRRLTKIVPSLAALGVTSMWIPPACKASWLTGNGYDIYDLFDLGEFDQKGGRPTKWGTKEELQHLCQTAGANGISILFDTVLNHKAAADFSEPARALRVDPKDRRKLLFDKSEEIQAWTGWSFPGRGTAYSPMKWSKEHFTGIDYDDRSKQKGVWRFEGKQWAADVDEELGNYDYLMFADIDHNHPDVRRDVFYWTSWLSRQVKLGGLRVDAIKHYSFEFLRDLVAHVHTHVDPNWFIVGEYWRQDSEFLARYLEFMGHRISLFDVQLVSNFSRISLQEHKGDLRTIFDDALVVWKPDNAVTFVVNHDTQAGQSLETPVAPFFIPMAYALILLRVNAGLPCVFYSDLFGSTGQNPRPDRSNFIPPTSGGAILPKMMLARQLWAYGTQVDYFADDPQSVGFARFGHPSRSGGDGLAVVMTNAWEFKSKRMCVGRRHAGEVWTDLLKWCPGRVRIDAEGWGEFSAAPRSVSVWVNERAQGRDMVDTFVL